MKKRLSGLCTADFMHPYEEERREIFYSSCSQTIIDKMNSLSLSLMRPFIDGVYVRVTEVSHSHIYEILYDVCKILDYQGPVPQIRLSHNAANDISPCGDASSQYIIISDYTLSRFDDDMMYYSLGNAVSMIKAGHVKLATIAAYFPSYLLVSIIKKPFMDYLHAADATSDRGGLLACQSFSAALKCHLFDLGMPVSETKNLIHTEEQAAAYAGKYLECYRSSQKAMKNAATKLGEFWSDMKYIEGAGNKMLEDLFQWFINPKGYGAIINKYGRDGYEHN